MEVRKGYKQTEVGVIPKDWTIIQLKDTLIKIIDNRGKTPPYINFTSIELIETNAISFVIKYPNYSKISKYITEYAYLNWFRGHPQEGDLLISTVGEYSGASAIMQFSRGTIAQNLIALRPDNKCWDCDFIFYWTRSNIYQKQLKKVMMSQAQPSLKVPWLLAFLLAYPTTKSEQTAIATALSDADALITSLEKLIEKKRAIKQGTMQELLRPKEGWVVKKLGEIAINISSGKSNTQSKEGQYPIYGSTGIIGWNNMIDYYGIKILVARVGANAGMVNMVNGKYCVSDNTLMISVKPTLNIDFIFFKLIAFQLNSLVFGSGQPLITGGQLKNLEISLPESKSKQTHIAMILLDMDGELTALEHKLAKYKMIKQGMMQELLTGKIRLV